jgi:hypothetical protein
MHGYPIRDEGTAPSPPERTETIIPRRIRRQLPDAKLVAILRDPVERCLSHFGMEVQRGTEDRSSFDRSIDELLDTESLEGARRGDRAHATGIRPCIAFGEYGRILGGYYNIFPREQIHICFTEELDSNADELMGALFDFLEIDARFRPSNLGTRYRTGGGSTRFAWLPSPQNVEQDLARRSWARRLWRLVPATARERLITRLRVANYRFELWNKRGRPFEGSEASPETLARLRAHYEADRVQLEALIGKPVPWRGDGAKT